mgnify:CR=1 FL=1
MTQGKILLPLVSFTIPLVLGNLFQLTYNAADSVIVGKYVGEQALAAVGTSTDHEYSDPTDQWNVHGSQRLNELPVWCQGL